ncbi:MAG: glycosyltransferase family 87 protein [Gemmataceae bacterium]
MNPRKRWILWTVIGVLLISARGPAFVSVFLPPADSVGDFVQDWASGRNHRDGRFIYEDTRTAYSRATGTAESANRQILSRNAHPPGAVLATLPFAALDYRDAHLVWNLATFALYAIAVFALAQEFSGAKTWRWLVPGLGAAVFCYPLVLQVQLANFSCLLGALIGGAFLAARRGFAGAAGLIAGTAAAMKLVPGLLLVHFLLTRQWRSAIAMFAAFVAINGVALSLFGADAFRTYAMELMPAVERENLSSWLNESLPGCLMRLFAPNESHRILPLIAAPELGRSLAVLSQLVALAVMAAVSFRSSGQPSDRDRAFAVACAAMLLIGPLTWPHSLLMLAVPVVWLAANLLAGRERNILLACLAVMWLPANYFAQVFLGPEQAALMNRDLHRPLTAGENLIATGPATIASIGIFLLCLRCRSERHNPQPPGSTEPPAPSVRSDSSDTRPA